MPARDKFAARSSRRRISQRNIIPTGVSPRSLGSIVKRTSTSASSASVANGARNINQITVSNPDDKRYIAIVERATYVDSVSTAQLLPGGGGVDESNHEYYHNVARVKTDGTQNDGNEMVDQLTLVNNTGAGVVYYFYVQVRYILNESGAATTGNV